MLEADVPADWVRAGSETVVRVTVRNPGPARDVEVEVTHDGATVTTPTISLTGGGTATYDVGVVFTDPRQGPVAVAGVPAGELTVAAADVPSPTPGEGSDADGGFGPVPVLVVALLGVLILSRSQGDGRD